MVKPSDAVLFDRWVARRDAEAFAELVARHAAMVYATSKRILGSVADAEDVTQDCFLKLTQARQDVGRSLGGWLHQVATNASLDRIRSENRRAVREREYGEAAEMPRESEWDDVKGHVDKAIAELPEDLRGPIVLHFLEGRTHKETAKALGLSRPAATRRIQRGVDEIRQSLKRRGVLVSAALLGPMLGAEAAQAAPPALTASLGCMALAGNAGRTGAGLSAPVTAGQLVKAIGGVIAMKKLIGAGVALVALLLVAWSFVPHQTPAPQPELAKAANPVRDRQPPPAAEAMVAAEPADQPFAVVRGRVVDSVTRAPIPEFMVGQRQFTDSEGATLVEARSYSDGYFEYPVDKEDRYAMAAWADDYAVAVELVEVVQAGPEKDLEFALSPAGRVSGIVVDARTRAPIPDALVDEDSPEPVDPMLDAVLTFRSHTWTKTDASGRFLLDHIPAGAKHIVAWHPEYPRTCQPVDIVAGGESTGVEIRMSKGAGAIFGYVYLGDAPAPGATVSYGNGPVSRKVTAGTDGYYAFDNLSPGKYGLSARFERDGVEIRDGGSLWLEANEGARMDFLLGAGTGVVEGTLYRNGEPLANLHKAPAGPMRDGIFGDVTLTAYGDEGPERILEGQGFTTRSCGTDENGGFRFASLPAGAYTVVAQVHAVDAEGSVIDWGAAQGSVHLAEGETAQLELHYGQAGTGRIHGTVRWRGEPAPRESVKLNAARTDDRLLSYVKRTARTDNEGNYSFESLAAGFYNVSATVGERYTASVSTECEVQLEEGQEVRVDLPSQEATGVIEGRVEPAGTAIAEVTLNGPKEGGVALDAWTRKLDADGRFQFAGLLPGAYSVQARAARQENGGHTASHDVVVQENRVSRVDILLDRGTATLAVTVSRNGEPVKEDVYLRLYKDGQTWSADQRQTAGGEPLLIEDLVAGTYLLQAEVRQPGDPAGRGWAHAYQTVTLSEGQLTPVDVALSAGTATLSGYIDTGGIWWPGLAIREPGSPPPAIGHQSGPPVPDMPGALFSADFNGVFSEGYVIPGVPPGRYEVTVVGWIPRSVPLQTKMLVYDVTFGENETVVLDVDMTE